MEKKTYRNVFLELGLSEEEIAQRVQETFDEIFYGENRFFFFSPDDETMGYMEDTGNHDARTEGMSYGMMMCVQTDHKKEFDALWKWARTYMYIERKCRLFRLVSSHKWRKKCVWTSTGRRGIFCDGIIFRFSSLG